ncbi:MAG: sigma 54-interacting transcriptional regulator, partial [Planctomycetota bacterium]
MLQFLVESPYERKLYRVDGDDLTVGRARTADIPLLDEGVRKRHLRIHRDAEGLSFEVLPPAEARHNGRPSKGGRLVTGDRLELSLTAVTLQSILRTEAASEEAVGTETPIRDVPPAIGDISVALGPETGDAFLEGGLASVLEINKRLLREKKSDRLFALIMDAAIDLSGAERGFLIIARGEKLVAKAACNMEGGPVANPEVEVSRSIVKKAMETRRPVLSSDAGSDERWSGMESVAALDLRSVVCVPLLADDGVLGALYVDNRVTRGAFGDSHVRLLSAFADQAALAITASRLGERMRRREKELAKKNRQVEQLNSRLAVELEEAKESLGRRQTELEFRYDYGQIVGRSRGIRQVLATLDKVTDLNVPVFIEGESGTGKELVARALHFNGPRRDGPFVTENCSAIPDTLIEKVLFGHAKGAFTGADSDAPGLFEQAHGGTLFLDEVGDMSPEMQKKILRVLQEGEVRRVGGKRMRPVDARIVCATNRDVEALKEAGEFREDLFWRLVVVRIRVPPLRQRPEDIPLLVDHFLSEFTEEMGLPRKAVTGGVLDMLSRYAWPGNVRELGNEVRRAVALAGDRITEEVLSERIRTSPPAPAVDWTKERALKEVVEEVERAMIVRELDRTDGNKTKAAEALGLSRLGLRNKIER